MRPERSGVDEEIEVHGDDLLVALRSVDPRRPVGRIICRRVQAELLMELPFAGLFVEPICFARQIRRESTHFERVSGDVQPVEVIDAPFFAVTVPIRRPHTATAASRHRHRVRHSDDGPKIDLLTPRGACISRRPGRPAPTFTLTSPW